MLYLRMEKTHLCAPRRSPKAASNYGTGGSYLIEYVTGVGICLTFAPCLLFFAFRESAPQFACQSQFYSIGGLPIAPMLFTWTGVLMMAFQCFRPCTRYGLGQAIPAEFIAPELAEDATGTAGN